MSFFNSTIPEIAALPRPRLIGPRTKLVRKIVKYSFHWFADLGNGEWAIDARYLPGEMCKRHDESLMLFGLKKLGIITRETLNIFLTLRAMQNSAQIRAEELKEYTTLADKYRLPRLPDELQQAFIEGTIDL